MNTGLLEQLADYGAYHDEVQGSIEATDIVEGVHASLANETVLRRPRSIPVGLLTAAAAAMAVLLVVGGAVLLRWSVDDLDDPTITLPVTKTTVQGTTVTTVADEPVVPPTEPRVLGPGSWSVAAIVDSASVDLSAVANEVASWDGVFEVGIATDRATWHDLTGFATCPVDGSPACAEGVVVLVADPWINETSLRLQSEYDAATVTANELAVEYWQTYADAVTSRDAPDVSFDATSLGIEIALRRPTELDEDLELSATKGSISMAVEVDVEGTVVQAVAHTVAEYPGLVWVSGTWGGSGTSWPGRNGTYLDASDQSVIVADLTSFTALDDPIGPRRLYYLAGLPLDAAVAATQLADGTPVWQRPVDGMVLIVDEPGSLPDRFAPFYDQDGLADLEDMAPANPFVVYDAAGNEIVRIEENGESFGARALIVTDLRVPPIATRSGISPSPRSSSVATVIGSLEEGIGRSSFAEGRIVASGDALWVGSLDLDGSAPTGALYRIDPATSAITDRVPMDGGVADMLVDRDVLWVLTGAGDLHRMDPSSGEITDRVRIACDVDDCFLSGRNDLMIAGGGVWLINPQGQWRIDPSTLQAEVIPDRGGVDYHLNAEGSADGIEVDEVGGTGGAMWLGEADGLLWSLGSHDGNLQGLDPQTNMRFGYEMHTLARVDAHESQAILAGDDIWLVPCCSPRVVRFDTATREISTVAFSGGWYATAADGALWIAGQDHVDRIDLEAGILTDSLVIEGLAADSVIADGSGAIWVSGEGVVIRIDASARRITDVFGVESGGQLLAADGVIWVAGQDGTILRIDAE